MRIERGKTSAAAKFPEFRAWHALLFPLFGVPAPDWTEKLPDQMEFELATPEESDDEDLEMDDEASEEDEEEDAEDEE